MDTSTEVPVTKYTVRSATPEDALWIAQNCRDADRAECNALLGLDPVQVVPEAVGIPGNPTFIGYADDEPVIIFGTARTPWDDVGVVWMISTPELIKHQKHFLKHSREWVEVLHAPYRVLTNVVDARNEVHIRWLKWIGFEFIELIPEHGVQQIPFYHFKKEKNV